MTSSQRLFEMKVGLGMVCAVLFFLMLYTTDTLKEKDAFRTQLEHIQGDLEKIQVRSQEQADSLQLQIELRDDVLQQLKTSYLLLEEQRTLNNQRSDEKKTAIRRIAAVDSLYNEVARHYEQP